ncbi:acyl-CoA dehydrogenase family protein [Subtercola lobariae]|uniref:Acyl-CoA dehydrogenase n=1 Tax=Subtercola lobariae TaxID=1588641 RepID=A0A917B8N1_9MICO|nr:acyl-CoA dehydrogenase family protein [Subtercola lobariae]GGF31717.1 acyl-CoA dehydrogenase [Subtercola lobariae]
MSTAITEGSVSGAPATKTPSSSESSASILSPTSEELVRRVRELQPLLARNAPQGEQDRRVAEEAIVALADAGIFKLTQPKRYGGYESSVRTQLDVFSAVAEADGGTAWVVTLINQCNWMAALFPERAQDDVWAENPGARVSGVVSPTSQSVKVDGGYLVTGRWFYNSGSWHADWAVLGFPVVNAAGETLDHGLALIPRTDLGFEETWYVAGMRSSGSNCLIAKDVFVPDHRIISAPKAWLGEVATEHTEETLYRTAFTPLLALGVAAPQLGMGRKVLEIVSTKAATKPLTFTFYPTQADSAVFRHQIAEAAMLLDTAEFHLYRSADAIDTAAREGTFPDELIRSRARADAGWAVENVTKAINLLLFAHGAASFAENNVIQRMWRDSAVAGRHAYIVPAVSLEMYGTALLARDGQITPML